MLLAELLVRTHGLPGPCHRCALPRALLSSHPQFTRSAACPPTGLARTPPPPCTSCHPKAERSLQLRKCHKKNVLFLVIITFVAVKTCNTGSRVINILFAFIFFSSRNTKCARWVYTNTRWQISVYMYCTTLIFYTGDSRAAFNILSLHQNRYLIYCCKDSCNFPPTLASWSLWYFCKTESVCIFSNVVAALQFWLKITKNNPKLLEFYDELNDNTIQMSCLALIFIFYYILVL